MADDNQRQYFADVVERLRREGDLGRNGKNSFKTVKDTIKEESRLNRCCFSLCCFSFSNVLKF